MKGLSPRQRDVLEAILQTVKGEGRFPSVRELGRQLGVSSPATVTQHLRALLKKGYLERSGRHYIVPAHLRRPPSPSKRPAIPVVGRVAAGEPITSPEHVEDWLDLEGLARSGPDGTFAVKVMGESMVGDGILDGDYVLVDPRGEISNGVVVVAYLGAEQEVTVKRFYRHRRGVELRPSNPGFSSLQIPEGDPHFRIAGRVVGLVRRF